jgi:hypothetical protein
MDFASWRTQGVEETLTMHPADRPGAQWWIACGINAV